MPKNSLEGLPEVFLSTTAISVAVSRAVRNGTLRQIGSKLYTFNLTDAPEQIVSRHLWPLVAAYMPDALIADRTAIELRPASDGSIFVISSRKRDVELPGVVIRPRPGPSPLDDDRRFVGGLFLSSTARAYLDNMATSRQRSGASRTLSRQEIEDRLDDVIRRNGPDALNVIRDEARRIAPLIGREAEFEAFDRLVGAMLGTRTGVFEQAQAIIAARSVRLSDDEVLDKLREILSTHGTLSGLIIDETENCPSSSTFQARFGSLLRAYALVGFTPDHDYRYLEINRALRRLHPSIVQTIIDGVIASGGSVVQAPDTDLLSINNEITVAVVIARCKLTAAGSARWKIRLDAPHRPDLTIAVRMDGNNVHPHDYYLLPQLDMREAVLRMAEHNGLSLDAYRYTSLDAFYALTARAPWKLAA